MDQSALIVFGMCAVMITIGVVIIRLSKRDRGMGAVAIALGVIGLLAYITAEEGAPPPETPLIPTETTETTRATPAATTAP